MAKKSAASNSSGISLVIVESPAKARTIGKYLGKGYKVEASIGHIRDLPQGANEIPEDLKKLPWSRLGVNVEEGFDPLYIVPAEKKAQVTKLKTLLKDAKDLYLATDEDREGEAISWHLNEVLKPRSPSIGSSFTKSPKKRSSKRSPTPATLTPIWSVRKKRAESLTGSTGTRFRRCCGARFAPSSALAACRASPCG